MGIEKLNLAVCICQMDAGPQAVYAATASIPLEIHFAARRSSG